MKHRVIRWNPGTQEYFCPKCGRTSAELSIHDARAKLEQYDCEIPSVDTASTAPTTEENR
jgi:hypothetical protein